MDNSIRLYAKHFILCTGALKTPEILLKSSIINSVNTLTDHGGFSLVYGKVETKTTTNYTTTTTPYLGDENITLNHDTLEKINVASERLVFQIEFPDTTYASHNKVYDFHDWKPQHPGGASNISKWRAYGNKLQFPSWHATSRFTSALSYLTEIGNFGDVISYNSLPSNLKSQQLYDSLFLSTTTTTETVAEETVLKSDLGFGSIVNHLQARDDQFKSQAYFSSIPGNQNIFVVTFAQGLLTSGGGTISLNNNNANIDLKYIDSDNQSNIHTNTYIEELYTFYNKVNDFMATQGYSLIQQQTIDKLYIYNNLNSIYHYMCSCKDVVDSSYRVQNKITNKSIKNLQIGDISVLGKAWGGSTSFAALYTGYTAADFLHSY